MILGMFQWFRKRRGDLSLEFWSAWWREEEIIQEKCEKSIKVAPLYGTLDLKKWRETLKKLLAAILWPKSDINLPSFPSNDDDDDELFFGMVDQRKTQSLISSQYHCQRSSPWISNTPQARFEPVQNLSSGFIEWSCALVITSTLVQLMWYF